MSKGGGTTVQKADPYEGQRPFLVDTYQQAQNLYNQGPMQFFPDTTFASPTEQQLTAEQMATQTALGPQTELAGNIQAAQNYSLMSPQNIASNPFLADATTAALRPLLSQTEGLLQQARRDATGAGQLGSDRQAILESNVIGNFLQQAGDVTARIYGDAFQQGQQNQLRALALAPQTLQSSLVPSQTLASVGAMEQARQQQTIDDARARFEFAQQAPGQALRDYTSVIQGTVLPGTQTTSGAEPSFGQRALGAGLLGTGTYGALNAAGAFNTVGAAGPMQPLLTTPQGMAIAAAVALASMFD
tara:strand:- start:5418 stop:6323 length:906 start_codon:yes stop_codon:yes gene_type:complete